MVLSEFAHERHPRTRTARAGSSRCGPRSTPATAGANARTPAGPGLLSPLTKTAPTGFRSWKRSPAPGTGVLTATQAGAWRCRHWVTGRVTTLPRSPGPARSPPGHPGALPGSVAPSSCPGAPRGSAVRRHIAIDMGGQLRGLATAGDENSPDAIGSAHAQGRDREAHQGHSGEEP